MQILLLSCIALLLASTVSAHTFIDNPNGLEGEPEALTEVESITPVQTIDYHHPDAVGWISEFQGTGVGPRLAGQVSTCDTGPNPNNPTMWPSEAPSNLPNGGLTGMPSYPLAIEQWAQSAPYTTFFYHWSMANSDDGGQYIKASSSYSAAGSAGCGDWGDDSWAFLAPEPVTAISVTFFPIYDHNRECNFGIGDKLHFEVYSDTNGFVEKIGHKDMVNDSDTLSNDGTCKIITVAFTSTKPFSAFTMWTQNGPGFAVWKVAYGEPFVPAPPPTEQCEANVAEFIADQTAIGCPDPL